ncbi:MAG: hypothetical protein GYA24_12215 [Candidatus Lokiarchaeota archaeon]|nr:hypothetical protein [Candidatus Lokiarchaeota archaeon]
MKRTGKPPFIKALPLLSVLSMGVLFLVCILCVNGSMNFFASMASYFDSGRSLFFPALPRVDLAWFLPPDQQITPVTWGNIIDIVILINLGLGLNKIAYDCYRRALESHSTNWFVDLHLDKHEVKNGARNVFGGKCRMSSPKMRYPSSDIAKRTAVLDDPRAHLGPITSELTLAASSLATRLTTFYSRRHASYARGATSLFQFITCSFSTVNSLDFKPRAPRASRLPALFHDNGGIAP